MEKAYFTDADNMLFKGHELIKDQTNISARGRWLNAFVGNLEKFDCWTWVMLCAQEQQFCFLIVEFHDVKMW